MLPKKTYVPPEQVNYIQLLPVMLVRNASYWSNIFVTQYLLI